MWYHALHCAGQLWVSPFEKDKDYSFLTNTPYLQVDNPEKHFDFPLHLTKKLVDTT